MRTESRPPVVTVPSRVTTAWLFSSFNEQIDRVRIWLQIRISDMCHYKAETLLDCLTQRVVEFGLVPYTNALHARLQAEPTRLPSDVSIDCGRLVMCLASGEIAITFRQSVRWLHEFLAHWSYCLLAIVVGGMGRQNAPSSVLVHNIAPENLFSAGSDEQFVAYCRFGPIGPLKAGRRFFVESSSSNTSSNPDVFSYCRHPLISLLRISRLGILGRLALLAQHLVLFVEFPVAVCRTRSLALLGKDMAYTRVAAALDNRRLIDSVVVTCEAWGRQPLWARSLRHAKMHMIWYSQSPQSASYVFDKQKAIGPPLRWIRVDTHWVWTSALARYLRKHAHGDREIEVVGPIIWQLPELGERDSSVLKVLAFDVPAVSDAVMLEQVGEMSNYYHPENLCSFITDIAALKGPLERALGLPVSIAVKMKRSMRPQYVSDYFDFIERLYASGMLQAVNLSDNLYSVISRSDLVIAYPFTSPAYLAEWLGVPAIFYDPTRSLMRDDFCESEEAVRFARGPEELLTVSLALLEKTFRQANSH